MLELNIIALAALVAALAFWAGWRARERKIPMPTPKRPLGAGVVRGATAAGMLDISMSDLARLIAEGKVRSMPGGLAVSDVHALLVERQIRKDLA